jgi:hypothetical protein
MACSLTTHGMTGTPEHEAWRNMKKRCSASRRHDFDHYGGRGIKVCDRWLADFLNFYADMGPRPEGHTLERIDVNGDYSPENCAWVTHKAQCNNRRSNRLLTFNGKTKNVTEWAAELGIPAHRIFQRIYKGKPLAEVLT